MEISPVLARGAKFPFSESVSTYNENRRGNCPPKLISCGFHGRWRGFEKRNEIYPETRMETNETRITDAWLQSRSGMDRSGAKADANSRSVHQSLTQKQKT